MTDNKLIIGNVSPEIKATKIMKFTDAGFVDTTPIVLFDTSGSMNIRDCSNHETRIEVVNRILKKMLNLPVYAFNDNIIRVEMSQEAGGGTNLVNALAVCKSYTKVILVSDGCPEESTAAMVQAIVLKIPFDTILIGNDKDGRDFMQELSRRTGGKFSTVSTSDMQFQERLEDGINKLLLCEGN